MGEWRQALEVPEMPGVLLRARERIALGLRTTGNGGTVLSSREQATNRGDSNDRARKSEVHMPKVWSQRLGST